VFKKDAPASLSSVLSQSPALRESDRIAWATWRSIVGHRVARHTMPTKLENGALHVVVSSALWASELSLLQAPILQKLRAVLPGVSLLRFRVGVVEQQPGAAPPVRIAAAPLPETLEQKLREMEDQDLGKTIREAAGYSLGRATTARDK
jgi:hypothetical protein